MDRVKSFELPVEKEGPDWTQSEIERAKDWFAQGYLELAVGIAGIELRRKGVSEFEVAKDCTSEWLCGRFDAESVASSARFDRAIRNYRPEMGNLKSFLLRDLRFYASGTVARRHFRDSKMDSIHEIPLDDKQLNLSMRVAVKEVVESVLSSLDERDRKILIMTNDGYSNREIGERLSCSEGAIKTAICRARQHARDRFAELTRCGNQ